MFRSTLPLLALLAASPALAAAPGVSIMDANGAYLGTPVNPFVTGTGTQNPPGTSGTKADSVQGVAGGVPLPLQAASWWPEVNAASVASSACLTANARPSGGASGTPAPFAYYQVQINSSQAGNVYLFDASTPGAPVQVAAGPVSSGTPTSFKTPAFGTAFQVQFCEGSTAGTVSIRDGFTAF